MCKSFTPLAVPFPAPCGYFDFSKPNRSAVEKLPHALQRGGRIDTDASAVSIVKSIVYALLVSARRTAVIDVDGAGNLNVFNGADFLAAYALETVEEASATLTAIADFCCGEQAASEINLVIADMYGKLSHGFANSCVRLSERFGVRFFVCADFPFDNLPIITARDIKMIDDDEISRAVTRYSVNRV